MPSSSTILLTGFGPFPGTPNNATSTLVPRLARAARTLFPEHDVVSEILPTEWVAAPERILQLLSDTCPALVLHFGITEDTAGFKLELIGRNVRTRLLDAAGTLPDSGHVIAQGPDLLVATLPAERIVARLARMGLPCRTSDNAGSYLCNAILYHSLSMARAAARPFPTGFVHVPASLGEIGEDSVADGQRLGWKTATAGGVEIIAACLENGQQAA
jgi:pyroglutamyl-peptidase